MLAPPRTGNIAAGSQINHIAPRFRFSLTVSDFRNVAILTDCYVW
jgi:hypothetical protein